MSGRSRDLAPLGWTEWFEAKAQAAPEETMARVAAVDRGWMFLLNGKDAFRAQLAGSYRYRNQQSQQFPCVGDWVGVERYATGVPGMVYRLVERRTSLRRKSAGATVDDQVIAANMDTVMIAQACDYDFNLKRLERYLVMVQDSGAEPCILLTKTDLVAPETLADQIAQIRAAGVTAPVLTLSNVTRDGLADLKRSLLPAKTYCFVGSSGVGKSTIINHLIDQELLPTQEVSETGEGRHTTVRREMIMLAGGALVIDNPGMREIGILGAESSVGESFADIAALAADCRFRDCGHANEPGCAVRAAVTAGELDQDHYDNYLKLQAESAFHQLSRLEKRRKDRDFGKFIKSAKKDLRK